MMFVPFLIHLIAASQPAKMVPAANPDPCLQAATGSAEVSLFVKDSLFQLALQNIRNAFEKNGKEHCISFGKDNAGNTLVSPIAGGSATSGKVPAILNAFADLHNHPNNLPPDAGDFYGLIKMHQNNPAYKTRLVTTVNGTIYALLVTDLQASLLFMKNNPPQSPAFTGGPPGFPVAITDEARELKYKYHCTDEMALAFILEKYSTGVCLLKRQGNGDFKKLVTFVSGSVNKPVYTSSYCS